MTKRKGVGQCPVISDATRNYCIKWHGHPGLHIDYKGAAILDGHIMNYKTGPRPIEQIYFGKEATEWKP